MSPRQWLYRSLIVGVAVRFGLAWIVPLTGDEAYFVQWGRELAGSYYDHGPMTGWWLWALLQLGDHPALLRLPAVFAPTLVAWIIWRTVRGADEHCGALAATLYCWSPPALLGLFITTDIPLLVFASLAFWATVRADATDRPRDYLLAGALLGLAFLSKYFAVLLGLAFAVWWMLLRRPRRPHGVVWLLLGVAPFAAQHIHWNYHHAWTNVMFNVLTRQEGDQSSWLNPIALIVVSLWLVGPSVVGVLGRKDAASGARLPTLSRPPFGLAATAFVVPHVVFLLVAFRNPVGIHWLLSFQPFFFVAVAALCAQLALRRWLKAAIAFGALHVALGLFVLFVPLEWIRGQKNYPSIVLGLHPEEVLASLDEYRGEYRLSTPSYSKSALLEYHAREPVIVLGPGSFHGRQDDLRTDFRELAGREILVLTPKHDQAHEAVRWFEAPQIREVEVRGARFYAVLGRGFDYARYREEVLATVANRYYRMPSWLERWSTGNFFRERYGLPAERLER